jgi:hypothetical protein
MSAKYNDRAYFIKRKEKGKDPLVDKILDEPTSPEGQLYERVKEVFDTKIKKRYIESALIASSDYKAIAELLEVPEDIVEFYSKIFFDVVGYDRLSKLDVIDKAKDTDEMIMKTWALHQGLGFIAWRLGKKVTVSPIEGLEELFNTCIYKAKEALFNANSTSASIESTKWAKLALDISRLLKVWVLDSDAAKKDIDLAIKEVMPDFKSLDDLMSEAERLEEEEKNDDDNDRST